MSIIRWEPFRSPWEGLFHLQRRMDRLFDDVALRDEETQVATWAPRVALVETDNSFEVTAELPGLERDDIKVELQDSVLTIFGEKRVEREKKDRRVYVCERAYGNFSRSFQLPAQVDGGAIKAGFKNGVLILTLPKSEEAKPRKIEVKVD